MHRREPLAPERAVAYRANQESTRRPTQDEALVSRQPVPIHLLCRSDEIQIDMRPRREVPVTVWVSDRHARDLAKDEMVNLDWILDKELAGYIRVRMIAIREQALANGRGQTALRGYGSVPARPPAGVRINSAR